MSWFETGSVNWDVVLYLFQRGRSICAQRMYPVAEKDLGILD